MSLLGGDNEVHPAPTSAHRNPQRQSSEQYSEIARAAIMSSLNSSPQSSYYHTSDDEHHPSNPAPVGLMPPPKTTFGRGATTNGNALIKQMPALHWLGAALTDTPAITPASTAPSSPHM